MENGLRRTPYPPDGLLRMNPAFVNDEELQLNVTNKLISDSERSSLQSTSGSQNDQISTVFYETHDPMWVQYGQKLMKLILMIFLCFVVASSASISVICFQLAIKGLSIANSSITINNTTYGHVRQYCDVKNYITDDGEMHDGPFDMILSPDTDLDFTLNYDINASVPWLWVLMFMMMAPEFLGFFYSLKQWCTSKEPNQRRLGPLRHLAVMASVEALQILAIGLLAYYILPNFCGVTNVMLLNCTAIVPSLIKFISKINRLKQIWPILTAFLVVIGQLLCPLSAFGPWQVRSASYIMAPLVTVCLLLVSMTYWSNFIPSKPEFPPWLDAIYKSYRRNSKKPAVQLVLSASKLAWIFGVLLIGTLTTGNVSIFADLFRFSTWSGPGLSVNGNATVLNNVSIECNTEFTRNFTAGVCYSECSSSCTSFVESCFYNDTICERYCISACEPCHRTTSPPTTTTLRTTTPFHYHYDEESINEESIDDESNDDGSNTTSSTTTVSSTDHSTSVSTESVSSSKRHTFGTRPSETPPATATVTCGHETLFSSLCEQTCAVSDGSTVDTAMILNFDCFVYNPATAGHDVISGVWLTLLMQIGCSWLCYGAAVFACKVGLQPAAFSLPLVLIVPLISLLCTAYFTFLSTQFFTWDFFPTLLFKVDDNMHELAHNNWLYAVGIVAMFFWYLSFVAVTLHTWLPKEERLAKIWKLFSQPSFWSFAIDKSLLLSRRHQFFYEEPKVEPSKDPVDELLNIHKHPSANNLVFDDEQEQQVHPKIFVCGTLWHEEPEEMKSLLTSVLRLNHDQTLRQLIHDPEFRKEYGGLLKDIEDKDFYELEFDLVFDDAFLPYKEEENPKGKTLIMNTYVRKWCDVVAEMLTELNGTEKGSKPKKFHTPYGGRLQWQLQGHNLLNVHLKNKQEIRHKKRWSQVMYMFYILDFQVKQEYGNDSNKIEKALFNSYLLTLDGDVDFHPIAVTRLIDLMKTNGNVGSVCGRIHPLGSGPMIWYQMFEYAVGHWFQKAAEHVFGCVLCSPGCFALFRGTAVAQSMETYATVAESAMDYLQHDQGEDRWLCTLLLQSGWRIEYCAASDAKTYAPEELTVFFGQRKRWTPSTLANQMDLLDNSGEVIKKNPSMTMGFMAYQMFMMVCTVIGTGSIFLMLFGSLSTIFNINDVLSLFLNLIVVIIYSLICYYCNEKIQMRVTELLSLVYGLIMIAVLVAICIQGVEEGPTSPNTLFLIIMVMCFVVGGLAHPQEVFCLLPGIIYFAAIPCTYMLLNIYTVCNCHKVNWGTRETPNANAKLEQMRSQDQQRAKIESTFYKYVDYVGNFFAKLCCRRDKLQLDQNRMRAMEEQLIELKLKTDVLAAGPNKDKKPFDQSSTSPTPRQPPPMERLPSILKKPSDEIKPEWRFGKFKGDCRSLSSAEEEYWTQFVKTKLYALIEDTNKKKVTQEGLLALRAKSMTFFYLLNAFYVLIIFLLQMQADLLSFTWPFAPCVWDYDLDKSLAAECKLDQLVHYEGECCNYCSNSTAPYMPINDANSTLDDCRNDFLIKKMCQCQEIEPVTIVVIIFFLLLLFVQFIGLIFHRIETGMHVVATTQFMEQNANKITLPDLLTAVEIIENMSPNSTMDLQQQPRKGTLLKAGKGLIRRDSLYPVSRTQMNIIGMPTISENQELIPNGGLSPAEQEYTDHAKLRAKQQIGLRRRQSQYMNFNKRVVDLRDNFNKYNNAAKGKGLKRQVSVAKNIRKSTADYDSDDSNGDDDVFERPDMKSFVAKSFGPEKVRRGTVAAFNALLDEKGSSRTSSFRKK